MKIEILVNTIIALILVVLILTRKVEQKKKLFVTVLNHILVAICLSLITLTFISIYKFKIFIDDWNNGYSDINLITTVSDIRGIKHKVVNYRDEFGIEYIVNYGFIKED